MKPLRTLLRSAFAVLFAATVIAVVLSVRVQADGGAASAQSTSGSAPQDWYTLCSKQIEEQKDEWSCYCHYTTYAACHEEYKNWPFDHDGVSDAGQAGEGTQSDPPADIPSTPLGTTAVALAGALTALLAAGVASSVAQGAKGINDELTSAAEDEEPEGPTPMGPDALRSGEPNSFLEEISTPHGNPAPSQYLSEDQLQPPEPGFLPPGDKVIEFAMGDDGICRLVVMRPDGTTYTLGGDRVPDDNAGDDFNNVLKQLMSQESAPNYGPNDIRNRPLGEEPPPDYGPNNILNRPLGEEPPPSYGPNNILNRPLGEDASSANQNSAAPDGKGGQTSSAPSDDIPRTQERPGTGNPNAVQGSDEEHPDAQQPTYSEERDKAMREGMVDKANAGASDEQNTGDADQHDEIPRTQERPGTGNPNAVQGSDEEDPHAQQPTYSEERDKAMREGMVDKANAGGGDEQNTGDADKTSSATDHTDALDKSPAPQKYFDKDSGLWWVTGPDGRSHPDGWVGGDGNWHPPDNWTKDPATNTWWVKDETGRSHPASWVQSDDGSWHQPTGQEGDLVQRAENVADANRSQFMNKDRRVADVIDDIENPAAWYVAKTGTELANAFSRGTMDKVEQQQNLGTLQGWTDAIQTGELAAAKIGADMYTMGGYSAAEHLATEGLDKGLESIRKDFDPTEEVKAAFNSDQSLEDRVRAGFTAVGKTANAAATLMGLGGADVTLIEEGRTPVHIETGSSPEIGTPSGTAVNETPVTHETPIASEPQTGGAREYNAGSDAVPERSTPSEQPHSGPDQAQQSPSGVPKNTQQPEVAPERPAAPDSPKAAESAPAGEAPHESSAPAESGSSTPETSAKSGSTETQLSERSQSPEPAETRTVASNPEPPTNVRDTGAAKGPETVGTADSTAPAQKPSETLTSDSTASQGSPPESGGAAQPQSTPDPTLPGQTRAVASTEPPATETSAAGEKSVVHDYGHTPTGDTMTASDGGSRPQTSTGDPVSVGDRPAVESPDKAGVPEPAMANANRGPDEVHINETLKSTAGGEGSGSLPSEPVEHVASKPATEATPVEKTIGGEPTEPTTPNSASETHAVEKTIGGEPPAPGPESQIPPAEKTFGPGEPNEPATLKPGSEIPTAEKTIGGEPTPRPASEIPPAEKTLGPGEHESTTVKSSSEIPTAEKTIGGKPTPRTAGEIPPAEKTFGPAEHTEPTAGTSTGSEERPQIRELTPEERDAWRKSVNDDYAKWQKEAAEAEARGEDPVGDRLKSLKDRFLPREVEVPEGKLSRGASPEELGVHEPGNLPDHLSESHQGDSSSLASRSESESAPSQRETATHIRQPLAADNPEVTALPANSEGRVPRSEMATQRLQSEEGTISRQDAGAAERQGSSDGFSSSEIREIRTPDSGESQAASQSATVRGEEGRPSNWETQQVNLNERGLSQEGTSEAGSSTVETPHTGEETVIGGGEGRPSNWETQRVNLSESGFHEGPYEGTSQPNPLSAERTSVQDRNDPAFQDQLARQEAAARARQEAADRVAQRQGYQNAAEMQADMQAQEPAAPMNERDIFDIPHTRDGLERPGTYDPSLPNPQSQAYGVEERIADNWNTLTAPGDNVIREQIAQRYGLDTSRPISEQVENLSVDQQMRLSRELEREASRSLGRQVASGDLIEIDQREFADPHSQASEDVNLILHARGRGLEGEMNPAMIETQEYQDMIRDLRQRYQDPNFRNLVERGAVRLTDGEQGETLSPLANSNEQALIRKLVGEASQQDLDAVRRMAEQPPIHQDPDLQQLMREHSASPSGPVDPRAGTATLP